MPVLRQPAAQARAQARSRGPAVGEAAPPDLRLAASAAPRGDPGHPRRRAAVGDRAAGRRRPRSRCCSCAPGVSGVDKLVIDGKPGSDWWRVLTASFVYDNLGYAFIALVAVAVFGWLLERRHGPLPVLLLFVSGGALGMLAVATLDTIPTAWGGNGAAMALLVRVGRRRRCSRMRRGDDLDADMVGVLVITLAVLRAADRGDRGQPAGRAWRRARRAARGPAAVAAGSQLLNANPAAGRPRPAGRSSSPRARRSDRAAAAASSPPEVIGSDRRRRRGWSTLLVDGGEGRSPLEVAARAARHGRLVAASSSSAPSIAGHRAGVDLGGHAAGAAPARAGGRAGRSRSRRSARARRRRARPPRRASLSVVITVDRRALTARRARARAWPRSRSRRRRAAWSSTSASPARAAGVATAPRRDARRR